MTRPTASWTDERERRAIRAHLCRCAFCGALWRHAMCRRDRELLTAAERLTGQHASNDVEREAFCLRALDEQGRRPLPRGPR